MRKIIVVGFFLAIFLLLPQTIRAANAFNQSQLDKALKTSVEYTLPYPGILPDNFLYPLKAFRDMLVGFFIADSRKRAEFDLLQADKRLAASRDMLGKTGEDTLVSQTASKAENYFGEAVTNASKAKKEGQLVNDFLDTLSTAGIKHQQVLYKMMQQSHGQLRSDFSQDIQRVQQYENQVSAIKAQK